MSKTFNAPYAGAGALMPIKGDTSLSSFSGKELAESSAIHGDFNQASLNYSGHQNLEVRGAEDWTPTQCADCGRYEENEDDYIGYCSRCGVNRCYDNCIPNATYLYELEMGESSDGEYLVCENCITDEEYVAFGKRMNWFAESFGAELEPGEAALRIVLSEGQLSVYHGASNHLLMRRPIYAGEWDKIMASLNAAESFGAEDMDGRVVNIVGVEDKVYVTIRFPDSDKIFVGEMEDVMLAESFAVEATEHHEIVLEVESELRGLHKALDIVRRTQREGLHIATAEYEINKEIEFVEGVLAEITEDDFDGGSFGAESFSAESRDELIDTLIEIRQELAKKEGMEDWENESEGPLDSLSSGFIQELIWWVDGDRDTWNTESFGAELVGGPCEICGEDLFRDYDDSMGDVCLSCYYEERSKQDDEGSEYDGWLLNFAESFGAEYGKRQRFGNRYIARDTKGRIISNVSVGRSLKADRRNKSKTPARSGFGHKGDAQKGGSGEVKLPTDAKSLVGIGAVLGGLWAYLESKA